MGKAYDIFTLLKESHDHGRDCKRLWNTEKSFIEFLSQYNLVKEYRLWDKKGQHPEIAKSLRAKGYTIRQIARFLGYKNPGSITNLLAKP